MKIRVLPYKISSASAKALAQQLGALRVYPERNYKPRSNHLIINYGYSSPPLWARRANEKGSIILNNWDSVMVARDKTRALICMYSQGVQVPEYTTDIEVAKQWEGVVVCRLTTTGQEGRGIVIAETPDQIVQAPLYTKHVRHKHEFRVHVMNGNVFDFTQKKKRATIDCNPYVRNSAGNWVFCREGVLLPNDVKVQAIKAVEALGLNFGAVDVAYREREDKAYVLEVNTAPGLEGTTLTKYVEQFKYIIEDL